MQRQEMKAFLDGAEFKRMLKALRLYTRDNAQDIKYEMIELWFGGNVVTGYACDGYKVAKFSQPCTCDGEFMVYIRSPRLWPYDKDIVAVKPIGEEAASVSFGEVQFTYKRPLSSGTIREMFEKLHEGQAAEENPRTIFCSNTFLKEVATSFVEASQKPASLSITLGPSPLNPIHFKSGNAESFLLPIRPPRKESDT